MKRFLQIMVLMLMLAPAFMLTSCGDDVWSPGPPPYDWDNTFFDSRITGAWRLISADGRPVTGTAANYMEFYGNGKGLYTYWDNGELYSERMGYWCEAPYGSYSDYQINIQYEYSSPVTMSYWLTGNNVLYMRWFTTNGTTVTYAYERTNTIP
ncbi:MAG: hypothetical protein NC201_07895 [Prevotella sp.]|nr:hypothetical protein [Bacteroides sp.]MCM1367150.1 hypothetical protein [Prevotella sp.]